MSQSVRDSIYDAISAIRLVDPHTHINPHNPASNSLADILGYHYYTELVHSSGMPREEIEEEGLPPRELVRRLVQGLPNIENTANYRWLIDICREFFGFEDTVITNSNWEALYDAAESRMNSAEWPQMVLDQSNVAAVFLTNDFDDDLQGFDTSTYIPCLRTDDLVFHLGKSQTQQRLAACTGIELDGSLASLRASLEQRFEHFVASGAKACAISLPPTFEPVPVTDGRATTALEQVLQHGTGASEADQVALSRRVFWTLAELCDHHGLPFDLMIGVNRGVYPQGVYQGQDLYDSRVSLIQYRQLFSTFTDVKFPVSVLASVTNQELCSYAWIFPNVITNGHWWYSNTPSFIKRDATARLEAVPRNNQIGYYSDAYKLEFVWPKFDMYRRVLAGILAEEFVVGNGWTEERAIELGRQVLRDNVDEIFGCPGDDEDSEPDPNDTLVMDTLTIDSDDDDGALGFLQQEHTEQVDEVEEVEQPEPEAVYEETSDATEELEDDSEGGSILPGVVAGSAALAAGAIGMLPVQSEAEEFGVDEEPVQEYADETLAEYSTSEPVVADEPEYDYEQSHETATLESESDYEDPAVEYQDTSPQDFASLNETVDEIDEIEIEEESGYDEALPEEEHIETQPEPFVAESEYEGLEQSPMTEVSGVYEQPYGNTPQYEEQPEVQADVQHEEHADGQAVETHEELDEDVSVLSEEHSEKGSSLLESVEEDELYEGIEMPDPTLETVSFEEANGDAELDMAGEIDPAPTYDEIQAVGIEDVELLDHGVNAMPDADAIDELADDEPLNVGDLTSDGDSAGPFSQESANDEDSPEGFGQGIFEFVEDAVPESPDPEDTGGLQ